MSGSSGRGRRDEGVRAGEEGEEAHRGPRKIGRTAADLCVLRRYSNAQVDLGRSDAIDERDADLSCGTMEHAAAQAAVPKMRACWHC